MTKDEVLDRIMRNAIRLSHLGRYYEKVLGGKPLSYEQELKLEAYFRVKQDQDEMLKLLQSFDN